MSDFVTIVSGEPITKVSVIKAKLESEGITCYIRDELTSQILDLYSNAIGGIRLQVKKEDYEKASILLKEYGFIDVKTNQQSKLWGNLNKLTSKLPFVKKLPLEFRLIILTAFVSTLIFIPIGISNIPTTYERITEHSWCVDYISYKGEKYLPTSLGLKLTGFGFCDEDIDFRINGEIIFPGFKTYPIKGEWLLKADTLLVQKVDTFQHVYEKKFTLSFSGKRMELKGDNTVIYCFQGKY